MNNILYKLKHLFSYSVSPYTSGYLDVGDGHELYYEVCGNPTGKPILFLHGGPGAGFSENDKRYFNPKVWKIILFDQRGAGKSKPFARIKDNTTDLLVKDIQKLLKFLEIDKVTLFGGSWGSTLALVYAIKHPQTVNGMIVRSIFLANNADKDFFLRGETGKFFPEVWERFIKIVPKEYQKKPEVYYHKQMQSKDEKAKELFAYEWAYYELSLLKMRVDGKRLLEIMENKTYLSLSPLEAHYFVNDCFLPENYILDNAHKLSHMPVSIIHGRYDVMCPAVNAYLLHQKVKNSQLYFGIAGHSGSEKELNDKLQEEVKRMYELV